MQKLTPGSILLLLIVTGRHVSSCVFVECKMGESMVLRRIFEYLVICASYKLIYCKCCLDLKFLKLGKRSVGKQIWGDLTGSLSAMLEN